MENKRRSSNPVEVVQKLKLYDSIGRPVFTSATESDDQRRAYNLVQNFLHNVVLFRASEVDLTPMGAQTAVRFVIDGVVQNRPPADRADADVVVDYVKGLAGMNLEDRRRPQTGKIAVEVGAVSVDVTVTTAGTSHGQRMQLKIVQEAARTKLEELGMPGEMQARIEVLNGRPGLLLVSGPARNGVTSTLYSLLRQHDSFTLQLASLEVTPAVELENVTQTAYKDQVELPGKLASALRRDPNVMMVDACETAQAAGMLLEAAGERNILLGVRADSAFVALAKWIKVAGGAEKAVAALKGVTCQMLLRKLCPACKEAFRPAKEMLVKLNLPAEKIDKFYRPPTKPQVDEKGNPVICPTCRGTGYMGRTAAFELLEFNDEIRQLVIQNAPLAQLKAACRKSRMLYLQEQALRKVIEGLTNIEEVIRVSKAK
jgi:type II secretory ATPase GspE/PulE/Tfp pilus assembly ATPase PilB-like protein